MIKKEVLRGKRILMEPLAIKHLDSLAEVIHDGNLWALQDTVIPHPDQLMEYYWQAEEACKAGEDLVFVMIDLMTRRVAGCSRFRKINFTHKKAIIGPTFIARSWQGSHINTSSKFLMLQHAFEHWRLNRVEFIADVLNQRSRHAIKKLGAREEGIIRAHRIMPDGRVRDSVVHSLLRHEWPDSKQMLSEKLAEYQYPVSA